MRMLPRIVPCVVLTALAAVFSFLCPLPAPAQDASSNLKPWRDGVVEAKSDAGFVFMASKGGFAAKEGLDLNMVQRRCAGAAWYARRRARKLRRQSRRAAARGVARRRYQSHRLLLAGADQRHF